MLTHRLTIYFFLLVIAGSVVYLVWFRWSKDAPVALPPQFEALNSRQAKSVASTAHLYFSNKENPFLAAEKRELYHSGKPVSFGKEIITSLINGPKKLTRTLPVGTVLRAFYILQDKTAVADFTETIREKHPGGIQSEIFSIYSIVNSLVLNIPEIDAVKFLIAGNEPTTLAGHIDLRSPFKAYMLLIR
jgi:hypothetical protein